MIEGISGFEACNANATAHTIAGIMTRRYPPITIYANTLNDLGYCTGACLCVSDCNALFLDLADLKIAQRISSTIVQAK